MFNHVIPEGILNQKISFEFSQCRSNMIKSILACHVTKLKITSQFVFATRITVCYNFWESQYFLIPNSALAVCNKNSLQSYTYASLHNVQVYYKEN